MVEKWKWLIISTVLHEVGWKHKHHEKTINNYPLDARWMFYCRLLNCLKHWHFQPLEPIDAWRPWFWPHHRICPKPIRIEEILGIFAQIWLLTNCSIAHLWNPVIFVAGYKLWSLILAIKSMMKLQLVSNQTTWLNSFHHHCCCCCCCYRFYHGPLQPSHCTWNHSSIEQGQRN